MLFFMICYYLSLQDMDSEMAVHLKRLARKDPTTKVKIVYVLTQEHAQQLM